MPGHPTNLDKSRTRAAGKDVVVGHFSVIYHLSLSLSLSRTRARAPYFRYEISRALSRNRAFLPRASIWSFLDLLNKTEHNLLGP